MDDAAITSKLKQMHDNSIFGKLKRFFKIVKITNQEIQHMRNVLKTEYKPIYSQIYAQNNQSDDLMRDLSMQFYDENIDRLPDHMIIRFYEDYQYTKLFPNNIANFTLFTEVNLSYSLHGWFRQKIAYLHRSV